MKAGETYTFKHSVAENETAEILGSGGLPVFSTPSMICLMEYTSYQFAKQYDHLTVGTEVNVKHLRACKVGTLLTATSEVIEHEGRRILFKVSVSDDKGLIGEGTHERFIINPERFMEKLA